MAIVVYTGVMGSGKTYEAVSTAALNALRAGRRVVTNISGFNYEAIRDYLGTLKDGSLLAPDRVVVISSERITQPDFFYDPDRIKERHFAYDPDVQDQFLVLPGDLVLIDEVWAFWGADNKLSPEHQKFFRMHRHYTEVGSGVSCDLVLMIQDLSSLHRFIRGVIESSFKFTKLKTLGLSSKYRYEVYEGRRQSKATFVTAAVKSYDKRIFPLYKSYDRGQGKEQVVDDRQNLFKNKWFVLPFVVAVLGLFWSAWWFFGWVSNAKSGGQSKVVGAPQSAPPSSSSHSPQIPITPSLPRPGTADVDLGGRLVGVLEPGAGEVLVLIQTADGRLVRQVMSAGVVDGWSSSAGYQGRMVGFVFGGKAK